MNGYRIYTCNDRVNHSSASSTTATTKGDQLNLALSLASASCDGYSSTPCETFLGLPVTGKDIPLMVGVGAGLLVIGIMMFFMTRVAR